MKGFMTCIVMGLIVLGDAGPLPQSSSLDYLIIPYEEADADAAALQSARSAGYQKNRPDVLTSFNYSWQSDNDDFLYVPLSASYSARAAGETMKKGSVASVKNPLVFRF